MSKGNIVNVLLFFCMWITPNVFANPCQLSTHQWQTFKDAFITDSGRVIDTANQSISHSEGQGYAMLMSVYFNDPDTFEKIWLWTNQTLNREQDSLFSWKWQPVKPHIPDDNNASDGDVLIAWALLKAYNKWNQDDHKEAALSILRDLEQFQIRHFDNETALLPGRYGFVNKEHIVVNPAYWVFPAFDEFSKYNPIWGELAQSGIHILDKNQYGIVQLPTDWLQISLRGWEPARQFPTHFSYSSYRIPLYLIWSGRSHSINSHYVDWIEEQKVAWVDLETNKKAHYPPPPGALAIAQLAKAATPDSSSTLHTEVTEQVTGSDYYSDSLTILSQIAYRERFCK